VDHLGFQGPPHLTCPPTGPQQIVNVPQLDIQKQGGRKICSKIHEFIHSIGNKEELPEAWKKSFILPIHRKGDKTDCNNYRCISLLSTTYKILSSVLHSRLTPHVEEITGVSSAWFSLQQVNY